MTYLDDDDHVFAAARPMLLGLAYRLLGSRADAEDAVQDTWLKWRAATTDAVDNPGGWLTTVCTRRCIDMMRSAHRSRVEYVGNWLPEPLPTAADDGVSLASSLTTAFLLVLERLTPKERAAYLLHEVFDVSYAETARTLQMDEVNCRKLVSRARGHVEQARVRHVTPRERQEELLAAFEAAVVGGHTGRLAALLASDVELQVDSGGKVAALRDTLRGREAVLAFVRDTLHRVGGTLVWEAPDLNGTRALVLRAPDGSTLAAVSFAYDEQGAATGIYIMRNPDKLVGLASMTP
ncbi:RNA polymerase sigma factor SigJ [Nannocystis sp. ILAH1]|uniref:RNA polymerase sigma factor SigJ n=1 Tax=unclassified Nannocystis TaxID=2627009 RepID=UPI00226D51A6|nr:MULTISPECIES: RNA polymerase sigma factor SigJ [unclassified Nannocystis]MCY0992673.1 RNA polymerase sigma factor SigJ [Nannocystis sp. ILAH1]MCY1070097.1 RNA polymerase sigma factor SigJ [Nannocystis sp. RBIL2]